MVAIERSVVKSLGFKKDHRIRTLDGSDQQAFGVIWIGWQHSLEAGDVREQPLRALAVPFSDVLPM